MSSLDEHKLFEAAKTVLTENNRGNYTVPAGDLYPHQWLWDSCFIAIGLRRFDVNRAQTELASLKRGQWSNGMIPNMIFSEDTSLGLDRILWDSALSPQAPHGVATSGITQPPMLAEAVMRVGEKLNLPERRSWYKQMLPMLLDFHGWLYDQRDPNHDGLIVVIHPYESGLDNSPPWVEALKIQGLPWWAIVIEKLHLGFAVNLIRRDIRHTAASERMNQTVVLGSFAALRHLRRKFYDSKVVLNKPRLAVQDLAFNCILVRANTCLRDIAKAAGWPVPKKLLASMRQSEQSLEQLWDEPTGQYYSKNFINGELIKEPCVATLLPLYSGAIEKERAEALVSLLNKRGQYKVAWPVPSVPLKSSYFNPLRYWQGPTWINLNWLIIDGLRRYGFDKEADELKQRSLELVAKSGLSEYFNPQDGSPLGADNFSWTAALTIDLLKN